MEHFRKCFHRQQTYVKEWSIAVLYNITKKITKMTKETKEEEDEEEKKNCNYLYNFTIMVYFKYFVGYRTTQRDRCV